MPKIRLVEFVAAGCLALALGLSATASAAPPSSLKAPLLVQNETNQQAQQSQDKIDDIANQTNSALQSYLTTMQQTDRLKSYNAQISKLIRSQEQQMASVKRQMKQLGTEEKEVTPLMLNMIDALRQFIKLDLPFHVQKRLANVAKLQDLMGDSSVTVAERFRQIMQAYQAEIDYGRGTEAYRGPLKVNGKTRTVEFVRVGRIALMYQTLNGDETGYWNKLTNSWKVDNSLRAEFETALEVVQQRGSPQLVVAPVPAPQPAEAK